MPRIVLDLIRVYISKVNESINTNFSRSNRNLRIVDRKTKKKVVESTKKMCYDFV